MELASWKCILETFVGQHTQHYCHYSVLSLSLVLPELSQLRCLQAVSALVTVYNCANGP